MEVGEYIRTRKGISKIKKTSKECSLCENGLTINNETHKHSKNIIDLIEVGDYVNGEKVDSINGILYAIRTGALEDIEIKTILTHEQYEQNCYKVGE